MANQNIHDEVAELLKKEAVRLTRIASRPVSKTEVANILILKGLKEMTEKEWREKLGE